MFGLLCRPVSFFRNQMLSCVSTVPWATRTLAGPRLAAISAICFLLFLMRANATVETLTPLPGQSRHCRFCPTQKLQKIGFCTNPIETITVCGLGCSGQFLYTTDAFGIPFPTGRWDTTDGFSDSIVPEAFTRNHPLAQTYASKFNCDATGPYGGQKMSPAWLFKLEYCSAERYCAYAQDFPGQVTGDYRITIWYDMLSSTSGGSLISDVAASGVPSSLRQWVTPPRRSCLAPRTFSNGNCLRTYNQVYCGSKSVKARYDRSAMGAVRYDWAHLNSVDKHQSIWCQTNPSNLNDVLTSNLLDAPVSSVHRWTSGVDSSLSVLYQYLCVDGVGQTGDVGFGYPLYGLAHGGPVRFVECDCDLPYIGQTCQYERSTFCGTGAVCNNHGSCSINGNYLGTTECSGCTEFWLRSNMKCTCTPGSGYFGKVCETTCRRTSGNTQLESHAACPTNSHCVTTSVVPEADTAIATCHCDAGFTSGNDEFGSLVCGKCSNIFGVPNFPCSGHGICSFLDSRGFYCACHEGFYGQVCEIQEYFGILCGNLGTIWPKCTVQMETTTGSPDLARYTCAFSGNLKVPSNAYGLPYGSSADVWPLSLSCTGINTFVGSGSGSTTRAPDATICDRIKTACQSQMASSIQGSESEDMCPLPFIDLAPPFDTALPASTTFCNVPANTVGFPVRWVSANFFGKVPFHCYRLSNLVIGAESGQIYRCKPDPSVKILKMTCDLNITRTEATSYRTNPNSGLLAERIATEC